MQTIQFFALKDSRGKLPARKAIQSEENTVTPT